MEGSGPCPPHGVGMGYARAQGVKLYYEECGSGPPLLLAHGALGSVALAPEFGLCAADIAMRGLRVIAYDARGHGRSGYTTRPADYHWNGLAEDMLGVLDAARLERASIWGDGMGAGTALMLALTQPKRVAALILQNPPGFGTDARVAHRRLALLAQCYRHVGVAWTARLEAVLTATGRDRQALETILQNQRREAIVAAIAGLISSPSLPDARLPEIAVPALILTQPRDGMHPLRSGEILHTRMRNATLSIAPSPRYWRHSPDALIDTAVSFLKSTQGPRSRVRQEVLL